MSGQEQNGFQSPQRRMSQKVGELPFYSSYHDIRGSAAKEISSAMGISEESGIIHTGHLIELRKGLSHTRISAHGKTQSREVMVFQDKSVIVIDLNKVEKQATQTIYSPNGDIEVLGTGWSYEKNGYHGPYKQYNISSGNVEECKSQSEKYETLINKTTQKIAASNSRQR